MSFQGKISLSDTILLFPSRAAQAATMSTKFSPWKNVSYAENFGVASNCKFLPSVYGVIKSTVPLTRLRTLPDTGACYLVTSYTRFFCNPRPRPCSDARTVKTVTGGQIRNDVFFPQSQIGLLLSRELY